VVLIKSGPIRFVRYRVQPREAINSGNVIPAHSYDRIAIDDVCRVDGRTRSRLLVTFHVHHYLPVQVRRYSNLVTSKGLLANDCFTQPSLSLLDAVGEPAEMYQRGRTPARRRNHQHNHRLCHCHSADQDDGLATAAAEAAYHPLRSFLYRILRMRCRLRANLLYLDLDNKL
jgi:hypothetical protein